VVATTSVVVVMVGASVFGVTGNSEPMLFLTSRQQRDILVGDGGDAADWRTIVLPSRNAEVTAVAPDPFQRTRFYVGTQGEGVYVYDGPTQKYVVRAVESAPVGGTQ